MGRHANRGNLHLDCLKQCASKRKGQVQLRDVTSSKATISLKSHLSSNKKEVNKKLIFRSVRRVATNEAAQDSAMGRLCIHLDKHAIKELVKVAFLVEVLPEKTVFRSGDSGSVMYVVGNGQFFVSGPGQWKGDTNKKFAPNPANTPPQIPKEGLTTVSAGEFNTTNMQDTFSDSYLDKTRQTRGMSHVAQALNVRKYSTERKYSTDRKYSADSNVSASSKTLHFQSSSSIFRARRSSSSAVVEKAKLGWSKLREKVSSGTLGTTSIELSKGDCFGKEALFHEATRTVTVMSGKKGGILWAIEKADFHRIAVRAHQKCMVDACRMLPGTAVQ